MNKKLLKLAKAILQLAEVVTDKATLIYEGAIAEGTEVYVEDENGELVYAEDGEYVADDYIIIVAGGKVVEIRQHEPEPEPELEPEPEPQPDATIDELKAEIDRLKAAIEERDARIADLEKDVEERDSRIAELEAKMAEKDEEVVELRSQLEQPEAKPAKEAIKFSASKKNESKIKFNQYAK